MINILLVDDHQLILDGLTAFIKETVDMRVVGNAKNGQEAIVYAQHLSPDIILMDIDMPEKDGLQATSEILRVNPNFCIIMLSLHLEKSLIQSCIQIGAKGYLHKDAPKEEILHAIRTIHTGGVYFSGKASLSLADMHSPSTAPSQPNMIPNLSERELEVLLATARGYTSTEIGNQLNISPRTVETHRNNLMHKLQVERVAGLIRYAVKHNLLD